MTEKRGRRSTIGRVTFGIGATVGTILVMGVAGCGDDEYVGPVFVEPDLEGESYEWNLPPGFPEPTVPEDNPMSEAKVELGRHLFHDTRLSGNGTQSCASCHQQAKAFTDGREVAVGSTGERHPRNSMSLTNVAYQPVLTWFDPTQTTLEHQLVTPFFSRTPVELGIGDEDELISRLQSDETYRELFEEAYPEEDDSYRVSHVTKALASFVRTMISGNSPEDRFRRGDESALSSSAQRGRELFNSDSLGCARCHGGRFFTGTFDHAEKAVPDIEFHNNALYNLDENGSYPEPSVGLIMFTGEPDDMGRFKAPTLRNIALTAPYMHDGSIETLDGVIDHYAAGGRTIESGPHAGVGSENPHKSPFMPEGFTLSDDARQALLDYLHALTDEQFVRDPRFSDPWTE